MALKPHKTLSGRDGAQWSLEAVTVTKPQRGPLVISQNVRSTQRWEQTRGHVCQKCNLHLTIVGPVTDRLSPEGVAWNFRKFQGHIGQEKATVSGLELLSWTGAL